MVFKEFKNPLTGKGNQHKDNAFRPMKRSRMTILDEAEMEYEREKALKPKFLLYHRDAYGFPKNLKLPSGTFHVIYSQHAKDEARTDRYGVIEIDKIPQLTVKEEDIFEIEVTNHVITKITARIGYDDRRDVIFALIPQTNVVKTIWSNLKTDIHRTLQKWKYARP